MNLWHGVVLGIVEGITEYLPISSTGHLVITSALLGLDTPEETKHAVNAYTIIVQGGAILAIAGLFWSRVRSMLLGMVGRDAMGLRLFRNLFVAFLPAALLGPLLAEVIEQHLFRPWPVIAALFVGGVVMLALTPWQRRVFREEGENGQRRPFVEIDTLSWRRALAIGLLQCVAMWPGTSRSMMTIVGGMTVGLRPKAAAEFSFLLGLPTLGGACVYKLAGSMLGEGPNLFEVLDPLAVAAGIIAAFVSAAIAVRWLVHYLSKHGVAIFGWYRIVFCVAFAALVLSGIVDL